MRPAPASAAAARQFVADTLAGWGCARELNDLVRLLVSELVTNAVLHARSDVEVRLRLRGRMLRGEVSDASPAQPVVRQHDTDAMTGRGLALVAQLASSWGVDPAGGGKTVWFEVATAG